jgi:dUTP pyrophosphatase
MEILKIKLLRPEAKAPAYAHPGEDAAFDIYSCYDYQLIPGCRHNFQVGIASEFPADYFLKIEGKSGHADRHGIGVVGGVIDAGYRGEWGIILVNHGPRVWFVRAGDKIAQGVLLPRPAFRIEQASELGSSERGAHGFGSNHQAAVTSQPI